MSCFEAPLGGNESMMSGCGEEDGDTEYNFPIDQLDDEKEEFRNDRAVRVSSKSRIISFSCLLLIYFV